MPDVLEGTIETPLGKVPKKTAALVAGGLALILVIVWYRSRNSPDVSAAGANEGINPATGYPYGSPEDAAALANQMAYVTPAVGSSGGGGGGGGYNSGPVSNAEWVQSVIKGMTEAGIIEEATNLSAALGKYINGQPAGDLRSLIEQAIAWGGLPPVSAVNGYPPLINTNNPNPTTPPPTQTPPPTTNDPIGTPTLTTGQRKSWIQLRASAVAGATGYRFYESHLAKYGDIAGTAFDWWVGNEPGTYRFAVAAIKNDVVGTPSSWVTVTYTPK